MIDFINLEKSLHSPEFFNFISKNSNEDIVRLRLTCHKIEFPFDVDFAITQIECRQKYARKLPSFVKNPYFVFPSLLAGEQATNEYIARYHASLLEPEINHVYDLTAGLGIDAMTIAKSKIPVDAVELNLIKQQCLLHNAQVFGLKNLRPMCADSTLLFRNGDFDSKSLIFIDPHRRDARGGRVFGLKDCLPDVTKLFSNWVSSGQKVILKLSPMLDLENTLREILSAKSAHIVSYKGEVKELLVEAILDGKKNRPEDITIKVIDIGDNGIISSFECSEEFSRIKGPVISHPEDIETGHYLYIPSAGMMKFGGWGAISARYPGLVRLSGSTPVFSSMWLYKTFPGRVLSIKSKIGSGDLKRMKGKRLNVFARNYPLSAEELRKKATLKEGGKEWLVGARIGSSGRPTLLLCSELESER